MQLYNGSLVINDVHAQDAGVYKCVGYTDSGPVQTFALQLVLACELVLYTVYIVRRKHYAISNSIQFNFILKTNRQTAVSITNRASMYVMQSVMMDKKHNMNNNNNKS